MRKLLMAAGAIAFAACAQSAAHAQEYRQDRRGADVVGSVRRCRRATRQWHQDLHETVRRHRRRQEDRNHPQGYRRCRARRRQAPVAGTRGARQGRHSGRLGADPERARRRRRVGAGQEIHGGDERRHLDRHHQVAVHDPHLDHAAADHGYLRSMGGEKRHQAVLHHGDRLRPRPRLRKLRSRTRSRRRAARSPDRCASRWPIRISPPSSSARRTSIRNASSFSYRAARSQPRSARRSRNAASTPTRPRSWPRAR